MTQLRDGAQHAFILGHVPGPLCAPSSIPKGTLVAEWTGHIVRALPASVKTIGYTGCETYFTKPRTYDDVIDATSAGELIRLYSLCQTILTFFFAGNWARLLKNAPAVDANCAAEWVQVDGIWRIGLYAIRRIRARQELTHHHKPYDSNWVALHLHNYFYNN